MTPPAPVPDPEAAATLPAEAAPAYPDPVDGLIREAAANRSPEDVARLVVLLEQTEEGREAAADVLRTVGAGRPLEDVSRLVAVLSGPPHDAEHADHMIRAAAESRSVEEVARLMALLYRPPLEPHCGDEAVRAAATHRPVEEVAELVERLARQRAVQAAPPASAPQSAGPPSASPAGLELQSARAPLTPPARAATPIPAAARSAGRSDPVLPWTAWAAALTLTLCGVAHVLVRREGLPTAVLAVALASSGLCLLSALLLVRRPTLRLLAAAAPVPAALAGAQLLAPRIGVAELSRATEAALAPPWLAAPTAAAAVLTLLVALFVGLARLMGDRRPAPGTSPGQTAAASSASG
ncbi:hypothetical protein [Streptomyces sp. LUP30]|uniref:hypothetical protein n=1 Tax=Streptomyces sp. LUP30 TaxID=1890285 RepID=UPI00114D264D|nr:hypothetical protein [Streptomyces sp. LUP30]